MLLAIALTVTCFAQNRATYAEKLGWGKNDRVLILHIDDAGMSADTNAAVKAVLENGAARSLSVMMPTPWVPQIVHYIKEHPGTDAGLHLTLTSEWRDYRWGPLAGAAAVPGLTDPEGALWRGVDSVVKHSTPEEVDKELRAQLNRAEQMGFHPTHLDSHMGTLFATPGFLEKYVSLGIEKQIPVMMPAGHNSYLGADAETPETRLAPLRKLGERLWDAGLPVLDDLHNTSYGWKLPTERDDEHLRSWRTKLYMETLRELKPGLTMVIMHCTSPTPVFAQISDSGDLRKADMLAMLDPAFKAFLQRERFIVTTWKDAHDRRQHVGKTKPPH
ncbi:MAG: polysaccharide deacetylase family protein [Acidobacteriota bacterium]|nr:polysaccharide deacetylase family protein [Acidobacteriota bacterium]